VGDYGWAWTRHDSSPRARSCRAGFAAKRDVEFDNNVTALDRAIGLEPGTLCKGKAEFASTGIIQLCSALCVSVIRSR